MNAISHKELFLKHLALPADTPIALEIEKAEAEYLYDTKGKKYLDLIGGISVGNVGHRHPKVVEAIKNQVDKYLHTMVYGEYVQGPQVELAALLHRWLHPSLDSVYLVNSGAEAIEGSMKLAKRTTARGQFIYCKNSYHGSTQGALSIMGGEEFKQSYRPLLPGNLQIEYNNFEDLKKISTSTAAVVTEIVQSESGYLEGQQEWLLALRQRCNEVGALLILDEIQTGFGRTGALFGFHTAGIVPDIIALAKGMGGGMPIGAFVASKKLMEQLQHHPVLGHITTFGGHPVSCAAAIASLEILLTEDWICHVPEKEKLFKNLLVHPKIKSVQGKGLMLAVTLESFSAMRKSMNYCIENGVITDFFLFNDKSLRISPPLSISNSQIEYACNIIQNSLDA